MSNTINIFNTLPQHQSDSEDEGHQEVQTQKNQTQNRKQNNRNQDEKPKRGQQETRGQDSRQPKTQQKDQAPKQGRTGVQEEVSKKDERDPHNRNKDLHKQQKDDLERPHPNDRHSGHGGSAYGVKPKKGGAGKGNWGTYKDEENAGEAGSPVQEGEKPKEEEKAGLTLQEYYQQHKVTQNQPQINEAKAKITSEQLMKEMGTATLLKTKIQQAVDDRKAGKKKEHLDVDHRAAITTEHANLLNFRTGFIEKEYKQRGNEDGDFRKPGGRTGDRRREDKGQEGEQQVAGETEEQTGEKQATEGTNQETEQVREEGQNDRRRQGGERRGYGGRGNNRGYGRNQRYNQEGQGEGRFQGDEQGEQGVSTGYTYKGGRGGYRNRGGNRYRERGQQREGQQQQGGEQQQQQQPQRQEQQQRGGQERRGEQRENRGDRQQGQQGGRRPYGGKSGAQPKVNIADEAAFPKLG